MKGLRNDLSGYFIAFAMVTYLVFFQNSAKSQSQTIKDSDGNIYSIQTMADNKTWMSTNLNINVPDSYCYENADENCKKFGRLYTWEAAQEGCKLLGEGWHLPSKEEWQLMTKSFGGFYGASNDSGKTAFKALLQSGESGFNALLGGGREENADKYARINAHGFYWTATETDNQYAWFLNFGKGSQRVYCQNDGEKPRAFSVRCTK